MVLKELGVVILMGLVVNGGKKEWPIPLPRCECWVIGIGNPFITGDGTGLFI